MRTTETLQNETSSFDENLTDIISMVFSAHRYFFSWRDPALRGVEEDWLGARNFCRKRCMDSVSLETSNENEWIKKHLVEEKVSAIFYSPLFDPINMRKPE